jgi:hypothetical protein
VHVDYCFFFFITGLIRVGQNSLLGNNKLRVSRINLPPMVGIEIWIYAYS